VRIFFDTNVLVSAFATRGLCADLFCHVLLEHELIVGEVVLVELRRALRDRIKLPRALLDEIGNLLRDAVLVPKPKAHLKLGIPDPDDEWILGLGGGRKGRRSRHRRFRAARNCLARAAARGQSARPMGSPAGEQAAQVGTPKQTAQAADPGLGRRPW
jgi:hypothetical protein